MAKTTSGWTRTTKDGVVWTFNSSGYLTSIQNRNGLATTFLRDPNNRLLSWTDYAGRTTTVSYNGNGYATSIADWGGRSVLMSYTSQGYLSSISYPATTYYLSSTQSIVTRRRTLSFSYVTGTGTSSDGNLISISDDNGNVALSNTYDGFDRALSTTSRGRQWSYQYISPSVVRVVDPDGVTIDYALNGAGMISTKTIWTQSGLGGPALRPGEPQNYVWTYERNDICGCALITKVTNPDLSCVSYQYDAWGNLTSLTSSNSASSDSSTQVWTYAGFAQYCRCLTYVSARGNAPGATVNDYKTIWTYDTSGNLTSVRYPKVFISGSAAFPTATITRNAAGLPVTHVDIGGTVTAYQYAPNTYDLTSVVLDSGGVGSTTTATYDQYGRVVTMTMPTGETWSYTYNAMDQLIQVDGPQPLAPVVTRLYDEQNNVYRVEIENKNSTGVLDPSNPLLSAYQIYNANNQLVQIKEEVDSSTTAVIQAQYTAAGRLSRVIDATGRTTDFTYDERGFRHTVTLGAGTSSASTTSFDYDVNGRLCKRIDPRGFSTTWTFNHASRPVSIVYPDGQYEQATWDEDYNQTKFSTYSPSGVLIEQTKYAFDGIGLIQSVTRDLIDPQGSVSQSYVASTEYGARLQVTKKTSPAGMVELYARDALGRIFLRTSPSSTISTQYDLSGRPTSVTRSEVNGVTGSNDAVIDEFLYDALGRITSVTKRDAASSILQTMTFEWDGLDRLVKESDFSGNTVSRTFDGNDCMLQEVMDLRSGGTGTGAIIGSITMQFTYDNAGRILTATDGRGNTTTYAYDPLGRPAGATFGAGASSFVYDASGNLLSNTDRLGNVVSSTYDNRDRIIGRTIALAAGTIGTTNETFSYDSRGRLATAVDNDSTVSWVRDSLGRLVSETQNGRTLLYSRDADGRMTALTYSDGTVESVAYDSSSRPSSTSIGANSLVTYKYSGTRVLSATRPSSVVTTIGYDALKRLTSVEHVKSSAMMKKFTYARFANNKIAYEKRHHAGGAGDNYSYDSVYRLIQAKIGVADPALEYATPGSQTTVSIHNMSYDAAANRIANVVTGVGAGTTSYTSDSTNFYTFVGGAAYQRNAEGALVDDGSRLYAYDYANRLVEVRNKQTNNVIATYEYDALGRRLKKSAGDNKKTFVWMDMLLAEEHDADGMFSRRHYNHIDGEVVAAWHRDLLDLDADQSTSDMVWVYPMYDGAFDCIGLLGPTGALVESYVFSYDGRPTITNAAGSTLSVSGMAWQTGYGNLYRDDETELKYALMRYYSPSLGRFTVEDPAGRWHDPVNTGNGYAYVGNSFRNAVDPTGLKTANNCCGKFAVVVQNDPIRFNMPHPILQEIEDKIGLVGAFGNAVAKSKVLGIGRVMNALNAKQRSSNRRMGIRHFKWSGKNSDENQKKAADYEQWMRVHARCLDIIVVWGHGGGGRVEAFGKLYTAQDLLGRFIGRRLRGKNPRKLSLAVLGACFSNAAGFEPYAANVHGHDGSTANPAASNIGLAGDAADDIAGEGGSRRVYVPPGGHAHNGVGSR